MKTVTEILTLPIYLMLAQLANDPFDIFYVK